MEQRKLWLDVAKGITIILMVLGHTSIPARLSDFIFAFHMPLFFIASGWMLTPFRYSVMDFLIRKFRTLLVPFVIYSVIVLIVKQLMGIGDISGFILKGWQGYALWFIPVLFLASLIARLIIEVRNIYLQLLLSIICVIVGAIFKSNAISLPWTMSSVPYASFLIMVGVYMRKMEKYIEEPKIIILLLALVITIVISHFWRLDMAWNNILPVVPLTIGAIAGTLFVFTLSVYICKKESIVVRILTGIGKETYLILAFSQIIVMALNQYTMLGSIPRYLILIGTLFIISIIKGSLRSGNTPK